MRTTFSQCWGANPNENLSNADSSSGPRLCFDHRRRPSDACDLGEGDEVTDLIHTFPLEQRTRYSSYTMYTFTELQTLRQTHELDKQDLRRFLSDAQPPAESIAT